MLSLQNKKARKTASRIARKIGGRKVIDDPQQLEKYSHDESHQRPVLPAAVVFPESTADVSAIMKAASDDGVFLTPRGGGTGKSGGAVPVRGGIVMSTEKMNGVEEIDGRDFVAVVRPGLILEHLHGEVEKQALFYPPDPASLDSCTLGGNVAENAGGPRAFKYGVTANYVLSMEIVTMDGRCIRTGSRTIKQAAGYNLSRLLVGSEGTLAAFTLIVLRVVPLPEEVATIVATFSSMAAAAAAAGSVLGKGLVPRVMEIMDHECITLMKRFGRVHFDAKAKSALLIEMDGDALAVSRQVDVAGDILEKGKAREMLLLSGAVEKNRFWNARRNIAEYLKKKYPSNMSDDISVPRGRIVEAVERIYTIARSHGLRSAVFGHAGDGNLHVNVLGGEEMDRGRAESVRKELMKMVVAMDGAISGEHGIGTTKRKYLKQQLGAPALKLQKALKDVFDPDSILNPGKIF